MKLKFILIAFKTHHKSLNRCPNECKTSCSLFRCETHTRIRITSYGKRFRRIYSRIEFLNHWNLDTIFVNLFVFLIIASELSLNLFIIFYFFLLSFLSLLYLNIFLGIFCSIICWKRVFQLFMSNTKFFIYSKQK